ncbi:PqiC family protein [Marinomonas ostreistagni]|uniref:PqiC family protein n=1 Tax=Marinomonas ostreistagni TaxID=359209 RepID=UPI00194E7DE4|nr:PqiC family protein [Marinomonas ostreistagni]MBM6551578.1 membrane integrity-associated transporter subunit PqiC [Marinomonas ostreistagni]
MKIFAAVLCMVLLSACATSTLEPPKYYVLNGAPKATESTQQVTPIELSSITLAEYLQSSNMVLQVSEHELFFSTNHLWAEPLQVGIEKALANQLWLVQDASQAALELELNVDYFHIIDQDSVILAGHYSVEGQDGTLTQQRFSLQQPLNESGYPYAVSVMSELVERLGKEILQQVQISQSAR